MHTIAAIRVLWADHDAADHPVRLGPDDLDADMLGESR